jgi:hypothetical protein
MRWRKSSYSGNNGTCVEMSTDVAGDTILVRNSTSPHVPPMSFSTAEMSAFILGVKAGEFDDLI